MARVQVRTSLRAGDLRRDRSNDVSHWVYLNPEVRGKREKFILLDPKTRRQFLFKKPAYGEFEIITEIFNSILAAELGVRHVQYFPAVYGKDRGVICPSFLNSNIPGQELWEMKDLICRHSPSAAELLRMKGRSKLALQEHNIDNIFMILQTEFGDFTFPKFFQMIGLDVLIGHGDRHWENYGVLVNFEKDTYKVEFAPVYDTAHGYLTEITDLNRLKGMLYNELQDDSWYHPKKPKICKIKLPNDLNSNHFNLLEYVLSHPDMSRYRQHTLKAIKDSSPRS